MRSRRTLAAVVGLTLGLLAVPAGATAATINVTTLANDMTNNGQCSLREAVTSANTNANAFEPTCAQGSAGPTVDTIQLGAGVHSLGSGATGDDANLTGDLDVTGGGPVVFTGAPIGTDDRPVSVIDGGNNDRLIELVANGGQALDVELLALELRNGVVTGSSDGGAVNVADLDARLYIDTVVAHDNEAGDYGGAVHFADGATGASFSMEQSEFADNLADEEGGALWLDLPDGVDVATIRNSTFAGNSSGMGGAIYLGTRAADGIQLFLENTTISGNTALLGGGALAFDLAEGGNAYFDFSTIANNTAGPAGGGAIYTSEGGVDGQFVLLTRTLLGGNTSNGAASNCIGPANIQGGSSIESTNSCGLSVSTSKVNTDPLLAPLAFYPGGETTTRTHGLYDTSPAANYFAPTGDCAGFTIDQRYAPRPAGSGCDLGAHEGTVGPAPANPTPPAPATPTKCKKKKKKKKRSAAAAKKKKKGCKKKKKRKK